MYRVILQESETVCVDLAEAMSYAKTINEFVIITDGIFEIVGRFGVDSVQDGICPDGVKYDWNKSSRIGRVKKRENRA